MLQTLICYSYIFATRYCHRPFIFQTINSVRSNCLNLKYQRFIPSGGKDIGIRNFIKALEKGIHLIKKQDFENRKWFQKKGWVK